MALDRSGFWLSLLWSDSAFPAGGASHSSGLEGAIQDGLVASVNDLAHWLRDWLTLTLAGVDLTAVGLAHRAAERSDFDALYEIDRRIESLKTAREEREASRMLGERRLRVTAASLRDPGLGRASDDAGAGRWRTHSAAVFGLLAAAGGIGEVESVHCFAYHTLSGMTSAAIRLRLCGQQAAQDIMTRLAPAISEVAADVQKARDARDMGSSGPMAEIVQMRHERARVRLFMS